MVRNLDLATLRAVVAIAETGSVTRAASFLNLTQSAVSMQIKRLEETLDLKMFDRSGRGIILTAAGEQVLVYARRLVALNDEAVARLTDQAVQGEIVLGVPHDIVYPAIPHALHWFNAECPRVRVELVSSMTRKLKAEFARGACDLILTTEESTPDEAEALSRRRLIFVGAPEGTAWRQRPLRLAFARDCVFRPRVTAALDAAGVPWDLSVQSDSDRTVEVTVAADLAVHAMLDGTEPPLLKPVMHGGALPDLPWQVINLYRAPKARAEYVTRFCAILRQAFLPRAAQRPAPALTA